MVASWLAPLHRLERGVRRRTLSNGIPWIELDGHTHGVAAVQVWFREGSSNDPADRAGIAHFLEHLMFRGSKRFPDGAFDREAEERGIEANAMTWLDYTAYLHDAPAEAVEFVLELEADRLANLALATEVVEEERDIILNERATLIESDPEAMLDEFICSQLPDWHPYRRPVIGSNESIRAIQLNELQAFYRRMRRTGRLFVVTVGDFSQVDLETALNRHLGSLTLEDASSQEPPDNMVVGWRNWSLPRELHYTSSMLHEARVVASLASPSACEEDAASAMLLTELLARGPFPILEELFEENLPRCVRTSMDIYHHYHSSLATVRLVPDKVDDAQKLAEVVFDRLLERVSKLSDDELRQAQERIILRSLRGVDLPSMVAENLAEDELYGDNEPQPFEQLEEIAELSKDDVVTFAQQWMAEERRSVTIATPSGGTR